MISYDLSSKKMQVDLPCFCYSALFVGEHFVSGSNDPFHIMKRYSHHLATGCRVVRMGAFMVNLTPLVRGGLSLRALSSDDVQSDRDYAKRMCGSYAQRCWDSYGALIAQFLNSLIISGTSACSKFSLRQGAANALMAYYLLLIMVREAQATGQSHWKEKFIPVQTTRNLLDLCGHIILASRHWPADLPWRPKSRAESCIEQYFGRVKAYSRGSPTIKDSLYGMASVHSSQLRQSDVLSAAQVPCQEPLSAEELGALAEEALSNACEFQAWISRDQTPDQVRESLLTWWPKGGRSIVRERFAASKSSLSIAPADAECVDDLFEDDLLDMEDVEAAEVVLGQHINTWQDWCANMCQPQNVTWIGGGSANIVPVQYKGLTNIYEPLFKIQIRHI